MTAINSLFWTTGSLIIFKNLDNYTVIHTLWYLSCQPFTKSTQLQRVPHVFEKVKIKLKMYLIMRSQYETYSIVKDNKYNLLGVLLAVYI